MNTEAERQAANVTPPNANATPGVGCTSIATSGTSKTWDLIDYPDLFNRYIDIRADGGTIYVAFDDDATGNIDESVAGTTIAAGTTEAVPWPISDGETISVRCSPVTHRYLHTKAATGTPKLRIRPSSHKVP